jgi:hypothetical protein
MVLFPVGWNLSQYIAYRMDLKLNEVPSKNTRDTTSAIVIIVYVVIAVLLY